MWLGSPLFIDKTVEEEFPLAHSAIVPKDMTRGEVEKTMETMAKVDLPRQEPMGDDMAVSVALKTGDFRDADGSGQTRLTNGRWTKAYPAWSPDGARIAFTYNRDWSQDIYVMNADGSGQILFTRNSFFGDEYPAWSPDGARIAFTYNLDRNQEIYVMTADPRHAGKKGFHRLTNNAAVDHSPAWSP